MCYSIGYLLSGYFGLGYLRSTSHRRKHHAVLGTIVLFLTSPKLRREKPMRSPTCAGREGACWFFFSLFPFAYSSARGTKKKISQQGSKGKTRRGGVQTGGLNKGGQEIPSFRFPSPTSPPDRGRETRMRSSMPGDLTQAEAHAKRELEAGRGRGEEEQKKKRSSAREIVGSASGWPGPKSRVAHERAIVSRCQRLRGG